jgi:hypothetical protein
MPKPCNLKTATTPKSESCSAPYELFTADKSSVSLVLARGRIPVREQAHRDCY